MSMRKINSLVLMMVVFIFAFLLPTVSAAEQRIYDEANLLTNSEREALEAQAEKYSKKRKTDFLIVTITEETADDIEIYMNNLYDKEQLGYNELHGNVAMLGIDIDRRYVVILGFQKAKGRLNAERSNVIREDITADLSAGNYVTAFEDYLSLASNYMRYKPGVDPDNVFYQTWTQLIIAVVIALAVLGMMLRRMKSGITTTAGTYRDHSRTRINRQRDRYLRKTVTRVRKPRNNNNNRGGPGAGATRSVGRTSGGHSYSRSRGKF